MKLVDIARLQDEASQAYNRVPQSEAAPFLQAVMLAEIVLQLDRIATVLEDGKISMLEGDNIVERLSRIGSIIQDK